MNPEKQLELLGKRFRELRIEKGYDNYEFFAYDNRINRVQYGRYENGANISFVTLIKVLNALEISVTEFFAEGFDE